MALLWFHQDQDGNRYEVRSAGSSLRLYTNGVFHSQYNPRQPMGGGIWDLLLLAAFLRPPTGNERVLVLGVGGGAVIRQWNDFLKPALIVGVELNPVHLDVARAHFQVAAPNVTLLEADARLWLEAYDGPGFDVVIDDLFGDKDGEPARAVAADAPWCHSLRRLLNPGGRLVMNFDSAAGLTRSAPVVNPQVRRHFATGLDLSIRHYANHIGVFCREKPDLNAFAQRLQTVPALDRRRQDCRLDFRLERLFG
ncbi:spermidine synthase [Marinimicrobium sp. ABcell2]|uniref:spermidine synthase n=1 Tax=Marinimicrobium sp. ABcell2 TaxID=3069751 RepID=UPI0027B7E64C|nr:methyltransferase domain-containing protein [Marinimicrobium sp. ABcell2]MDQ2075508.1 methyltransferase domain-containing protein [Marinimicrobium sp. ABcell2]